MKTDAQLKKDIGDELEWEPSVNATHIGVSVDRGVVTLTGHIDTYAEKAAIERAVQRVQGVQAIALELDVKLAPNHQRSDTELAQSLQSALQAQALVPASRISMKVEHGWVTLSGEVDWDYQRSNAERTVHQTMGVVGVSNRITLKARTVPTDVSNRIKDALARQAEREARGIEVSIAGSTATLRGSVHSWAERNAAQGAAWSAPGIGLVVNELKVQP
ncbi:MAG: BON domain-containing protein [Burkholderiaceae bacterium]|jgi:osmotically-inducible protein OsmY